MLETLKDFSPYNGKTKSMMFLGTEIDNHAGKTKDIFWLAGMTDGDGCIGIHKQAYKGGCHYVPEYTLTTTCQVTYLHITDVLTKLGVGHHWTLRKVTNPNWKNRWCVEIRGMLRMKLLLELLLPALITKKEEALLMLEYITARLAAKKSPYSERELFLIQQVKDIKKLRNGNL